MAVTTVYIEPFQVTFEYAHNYSPPPRCFSTAVKWCICFIMKFQFLNMIFNTSKRTIKLKPAIDVLKIMLCWCVEIKNYDTGFSSSLSNVNILIHRVRHVNPHRCDTSFPSQVIFNCFSMIFNTTQAGFSLTVLYMCYKIMCWNWNFILKKIHNLTAVEKHLGFGE